MSPLLTFLLAGIAEARRADGATAQADAFPTDPEEVRRRFEEMKRSVGGPGCLLHPTMDGWRDAYLGDLAAGRTARQAYDHVMRMACGTKEAN